MIGCIWDDENSHKIGEAIKTVVIQSLKNDSFKPFSSQNFTLRFVMVQRSQDGIKCYDRLDVHLVSSHFLFHSLFIQLTDNQFLLFSIIRAHMVFVKPCQCETQIIVLLHKKGNTTTKRLEISACAFFLQQNVILQHTHKMEVRIVKKKQNDDRFFFLFCMRTRHKTEDANKRRVLAAM